MRCLLKARRLTWLLSLRMSPPLTTHAAQTSPAVEWPATVGECLDVFWLIGTALHLLCACQCACAVHPHPP